MQLFRKLVDETQMGNSCVNMQPEICYQNSQSFYPSESFTLDHISMRHPVNAVSTNQGVYCSG